jgi:hypothetical protein
MQTFYFAHTRRKSVKNLTPFRFHINNNAIRDLLKTSYPEIANATIRERDENGLHIVEFLPQPGRKG